MYSALNDTICAPATIPGTGAISIIRVSGPDALAIAGKIISCKGTSIYDTEGYRLRYGTIFEQDGDIVDNVIVSVFHSPHSYTGENSVEISCHASSYIVSRIIQLLIEAGARAAGPGEFTQRAFMNGKMDLAQAEAVADVIAGQSKAAHRIAMNQLKGGYSKDLKALRDKLLKMTSLLELELDFSEEDVEFASREELNALVKETLSHIEELTASFKVGNAIKNGIPVAIIGTVNAGKSTLLNALIGEERAIVSSIAGTTRDTVEETFNIGGVMLRFIDTAGIRNTDETVEKIGIQRSLQKMSEASIVLGMIDRCKPENEIMNDVRFLLDNVNRKEQKLIILLNKCDLAGSSEDIPEGVAVGSPTYGSRDILECIIGDIPTNSQESISAGNFSNISTSCFDDRFKSDSGDSLEGKSDNVLEDKSGVVLDGVSARILKDGSNSILESDSINRSRSGCDNGIGGKFQDDTKNIEGIDSKYNLRKASEDGSKNITGNVPSDITEDISSKVLTGITEDGSANRPKAILNCTYGNAPESISMGISKNIEDGISVTRDEPVNCNNNAQRENNIISSIDNKTTDIPIINISAKTGFGLSTLVKTLSETASRIVGTTDSTLVTNIRHYEALTKAATSLQRVRTGLSGLPLPPDLIAQDLREALHHLGSILGEISTDEVLGNIFKNFCIGK